MRKKDNTSAQKQLEEQAEKEKTLQLAYTEINHIFNISFPICFIDKYYTIIHVNDTFCSFFKIPREEILGRKCYEIKRHPFCETQNCTIVQLSSGAENCEFETEFEIDNEKKSCIISARPYRDPTGEVLGIVENLIDITARRKAEKELRDSEEKFRSLFNNAHDSITITDLEGHFLEVNAAAIERLGYSREEYLKMTTNNIVAAEYIASIPQRIIELKKQGHAIFETAHRRRDGAIIPIEMSIQAIEYEGYKAILGIARDITERKRLENIQNQVISITSHELRTPISALSQSISNLQKYYEKLTEAEKKRLIDSLARNTEILTELTNDLLLISQLDQQKLKLEWIQYFPYNILHDVLDQLEQKRSAKEIEINIDVNQNIQLFGDPKRIGQIFQIFLDNSLKYSAKNTEIHIKAIDHYKGKYNSKNLDGLLMQFNDSGRGIRPEDIPYLFTPFFRSEEVRSIPGTGLGLSIALNLIQLQHGEIYVESTYGKGTTFFLFLPRLKKYSPIKVN